MPSVPIRVLLIGARRLNHGSVISGPPHELQSDWQVFRREAAGHGNCRKPAQVADAAERVWKNEVRFEICL